MLAEAPNHVTKRAKNAIFVLIFVVFVLKSNEK